MWHRFVINCMKIHKSLISLIKIYEYDYFYTYTFFPYDVTIIITQTNMSLIPPTLASYESVIIGG
jgi:hypothetical protein